MTSRVPRVLKAIEFYTKNKPNQFDSSIVLNKIKQITSSDGVTRGSFVVDKSMCNGIDTLHGGFISACTDTLVTFAHIGNTGKIAWTMNLNMNFISTAKIGEEVMVETSAVRKGSYPVMETKFIKSDGALVATGITSLLNGNEKYQKFAKEVYNVEPDE